MRPPWPVLSWRPISSQSSDSSAGALTIMSSRNCSLASTAFFSGAGCAPTVQIWVRMGIPALLLVWGLGLGHGLLDQGIGQLLVHLAGLVQAGFELVAERHQLIDFGDDAVLFGEWRDRYQ